MKWTGPYKACEFSEQVQRKLYNSEADEAVSIGDNLLGKYNDTGYIWLLRMGEQCE